MNRSSVAILTITRYFFCKIPGTAFRRVSAVAFVLFSSQSLPHFDETIR
jgi:hypothetical protein